ncbi:hypothetical protein GSI_15424 [Ganoderma sinense ZZ0214-1]|uniref:Mus7/MMS22 family-domain-containing protein n=1 Tax=Ganoderma sinense ZZ0214-1 TaxID=1077348 RepID=A0A2G8RMK5_9APHY|nr:hypothetical protein GSI_15424 [Ganoderma sinense ZZ0214-1]
MASADEVVDTSDLEELEEIAASKPDYWLTPPRDLPQRHESKQLPLDIRNPESPPRKRRKLDSSPEHPSTPLQPRTNLPPYTPQRSQPTSHFPDENSNAPTSSPSSFLFPSPSPQPRHFGREALPGHAEDDVWAGGDADFVQGSSKQSAQREVQRKASTRSPSPSPDPLLLFTPPRPTSVSSGAEHLAASSPTSSPLTPASSPTKPAEARHSPSPDAQPRLSLARQHDMSPLSAAAIAAIKQAEEAERSRYSLRTRNARQLKPYAYDMRMYNRQMRSNPEAIVTPSRVRRRHRSTSAHPRDGSSGGEDEYEAGEDGDMDDEDSMARRRRRGADVQQEAEEGGDGIGEHAEKWMPDAFRQSSSSSEDDADEMFRSTVRKEKKAAKEHRRKRPKPFPLAKKDFRSSPSPHNQAERSPSPFHKEPPHPKERPKPRPRPRAPTADPQPEPQQDEEDDDDDMPLVPPPTWRRRRSKTFSFSSPQSSPKSSPRSQKFISPPPHQPPADDDFFAEQARDLDLFDDYDNVFARAQSPLALATASGTEPDEPTSQHPPPPTSDEPMDVIDISSSEDGDDPAVNSSSSSESGSEADEVNRKRLRILGRMMPAVMVQKMTATEKAKKAARAERERDGGAGDVEHGHDQPLMPGQSRRRIGSRRSVEIRGDSESSDDDDVDMRSRSPSPAPGRRFSYDGADNNDAGDRDRNQVMSDAEGEVIEPIGHQPRPKFRPGHISVSDDDLSSDSEDEDVDMAVGRWVSGAPVKPKQRVRDDGVVKERDMIDRMLSRTSGNVEGIALEVEVEGVGVGNVGGMGTSGIMVFSTVVVVAVAAAAAVVGAGGKEEEEEEEEEEVVVVDKQPQDTADMADRRLLDKETAFESRRQAQSDVVPPAPAPNEVQFTGDEPAEARAKKAKQKARQAGVYVFKSGAAQIVSGRSNATHFTIDEETGTNQRPPLRNADRTRPPTSKSKSRLQRQGSKRGHSTLEEFWNPDDDHYEHDGFVVSDDPAPGPSSQHNLTWKGLRHVTVDFGIQPLPAGLAFSNATYLGHGWLHELIALLPVTHDIPIPHSCSMFDCYLHVDMTVLEFTTCLDALYNRLRDLVLGSAGPADYDLCQNWQSFFHSVSQHLSYLLVKADNDTHATLATNTEALLQRLGSLMEDPTEVIPDDEVPNPLVLQVLWFLIETSCRIACDRRRKRGEPDRGTVATTLIALIRKLWDFTFGDTAVPLDLTREGITGAQTSRQIAELWICLLNLANDKTFQSSYLPQGMSFWTCYLQVLRGKGLQPPQPPQPFQASQTDVKVLEAIWKSIFVLCALSQFSIHGHSSMAPRLIPSWQTIAAILEHAPLAAKTEVEKSWAKRIVRKRDEYVSVLVARCSLLNYKWHWRLGSHDVLVTFNRLVDVFKSRHFANLVSDAERNDFPSFLRRHNLSLLQEKKHGDSAFVVFLKLVFRAADEMRRDNPQATASQIFLKKILSLTIPVSSVPFKKTSPPSSHEMSMLFNRFSSIAVAICLEPTPDKVKDHLSRAHRYVNFKDADKNTRIACIRGAMYLAILLRHLDLLLTGVLKWLAEMTDILIDEYQAASADQAHEKSWTEYTIQLLLRSVCHILQTSSMDPGHAGHKYPDPSLLQGPWVTRIFSTGTSLSINTSTSNEIRTFVQAFLDARGRVIPRPRRPPPRVAVEDSQDSQDDYGQFDIDLDDPELLAALGEDAGPSDYKENKDKDKLVCETIDKYISPAIYRLVCKHFNDPVYRESRELSFHDADKWVDCWVGCASVMVQNGKKDWAFYFQYGSQSWEHITDPDGKRRVGLRFMFMLLQLDPPAYQTHMEQFIEVLFRSMATPNITLEHDYASLLFSIDRLYHPLLVKLPIDAPAEDGDFHLTRQEFIEKRVAILETMIKNLSNSLEVQGGGDHTLNARNNTYINSIMAFITTMKEICEGLDPSTVIRANYIPFCKQISDIFVRYPTVLNHPRLTALTTWLRSVS